MVSRQARELNAAVGDALVDRYVDWREECSAVRVAYERWYQSDRRDSATAFAAYGAALDREERAGDAYAELVRRVTRTSPRSG
jgi:hypothetical protein